MAILDYDDVSNTPEWKRVSEREVAAILAKSLGMQPPNIEDNQAWFSFPEKIKEVYQQKLWDEQNERNRRWGTMVRNT